MRRTSRYVPVLQLLMAFIAAAVLNGCGFQLRGSHSLPAVMASTAIEGSDRFSSLTKDIESALVLRGVRVVSKTAAATAILKVLSSQANRRVLTVDAAGKVQEYEIRHTIRFHVTTPEQQFILQEQRLSLSQDFVFVRTDVLGKEHEEAQVRRDLQRDLVNLMMLRMASAGY